MDAPHPYYAVMGQRTKKLFEGILDKKGSGRYRLLGARCDVYTSVKRHLCNTRTTVTVSGVDRRDPRIECTKPRNTAYLQVYDTTTKFHTLSPSTSMTVDLLSKDDLNLKVTNLHHASAPRSQVCNSPSSHPRENTASLSSLPNVLQRHRPLGPKEIRSALRPPAHPPLRRPRA